MIKAWYIHSNIKQKVRMFRNSMLGCITIASGYGILILGLHCKQLQRYFTQIIRLKLDINNKTLDLWAVHVTRERGRGIYALTNMLGFLYLHCLWGYTVNYEERIEFAGMNCIIDHIIYLFKCIYSHSHRLGINYYLTFIIL